MKTCKQCGGAIFGKDEVASYSGPICVCAWWGIPGPKPYQQDLSTPRLGPLSKATTESDTLEQLARCKMALEAILCMYGASAQFARDAKQIARAALGREPT